MNPLSILTSLCAIGAAALLIYAWPITQTVQDLELERAEVLNIKYGLLSVDEWKQRSYNAIAERVEAFDFDPEDKVAMQAQTQRLLHLLLDEAERVVEQQEEEDSFFGGLRGAIREFVIDFDELREELPSVSQNIVAEAGDMIGQYSIKELALGQLESMLDLSAPRQDAELQLYFSSRYNCEDLASCGVHLSQEINQEEARIKGFKPAFLLLFVLPLVYFLLQRKSQLTRPTLIAATVLSVVFLIGGLFFPMIAIDARVESLQLELLGAQVDFGQQVLFYQSKSILEVIGLLIGDGAFDTLLVGLLILFFSVLFPATKLLATLWIRPGKGGRLLDYLTTKAGKWSMADVFVVSIFMAFIGLRGMVSSQMAQLSNSNAQLELIATDYTSLKLGFTLFLLFCLSSLWLSSLLQNLNKTSQLNQEI